MPTYVFQCTIDGHSFDALCPMGVSETQCKCGCVAVRTGGFPTNIVTTFAPTPETQRRHDLTLFREATAERAHYAAREDTAPQRNLWLEAKQRANLVRRGLASPPSGSA